LVDESAKPSFRFISFGRDPAVEVIVDSENAVGVNVLESLSPAVQTIEPTKICVR
jgi:ribosome maturation factor RimP